MESLQPLLRRISQQIQISIRFVDSGLHADGGVKCPRFVPQMRACFTISSNVLQAGIAGDCVGEIQHGRSAVLSVDTECLLIVRNSSFVVGLGRMDIAHMTDRMCKAQRLIEGTENFDGAQVMLASGVGVAEVAIDFSDTNKRLRLRSAITFVPRRMQGFREATPGVVQLAIAIGGPRFGNHLFRS